MIKDKNKLINQLKWFKEIGIEYYCLEKNISSTIILNNFKKQPSLLNLTSEINMISNKKTIKISNNSAIEIARSIVDKVKTITELQEALMNFEGCELKKMANKTVFADGNPNSEIMLIGEAPGANEDLKGIPFCGESGKLLDHMLESIDISRQNNAYITNTVFWRPPANRAPTIEEIDICRPFVEKHIAIVKPKLIILVGSTAATSLLGKHAGITKIRQEYYSYSNQYLMQPIQTTAIFHPAYLLRQPMQKKTTWYDLLNIQKYLVANRNK